LAEQKKFVAFRLAHPLPNAAGISNQLFHESDISFRWELRKKVQTQKDRAGRLSAGPRRSRKPRITPTRNIRNYFASRPAITAIICQKR